MIFDALTRIKPAIETGPVFKDECLVVADGGFLSTRSTTLEASQPCKVEDFAVNGPDFSKILAAGSQVKVTPKQVSVKNGSISERLARATEFKPFTPPASKGVAVTPEVGWTLKEMLEFTGSEIARPWTMSVLYHEGYFYATNDAVLVRSKESCSLPWGSVSLPHGFAQYLARFADEIGSVGIDERGFFAWTKNGGWVRAPGLENQMPLKVVQAFQQLYKEPSWAITSAEVRDTLLQTAQRVEDAIHLTNSSIGAVMSTREVSASIKLNVEDACFTAKHFISAVSIATHIDFDAYPKPVPFKSTKIVGIMASRAK